MRKIKLFLLLNLIALNISAVEFKISSPSQVEDVILRQSDLVYEDDNYWTGWNFGASQVLDIGYAIAMWNQWRGNVLIRFDLRGVDCGTVDKAILRIYKPRNITQMSATVPVGLFKVKEANKEWQQGNMESLPQYTAASWQSKGNGEQWAGGESGCGIPGIDYYQTPLGTALASKYDGEWLEFALPAELVQDWLDKPGDNAGLLLKVISDKEILGDHVLFYSTEHASGKGPQLIIEGSKLKSKTNADKNKNYNNRYVMPPQGKAFKQYLEQKDFRYTYWTTDSVVNLKGDQKIYPYYWDIVVDGEYVLPYAYYPFSQSILEIDNLIDRKDIAGLKKFQKDRLKYLHLWEYVREQRWYDCGDIIEVMSPLQAAYIWLGSKKYNRLSFDGILYKIHPRGNKNLTQEEIQLRRVKEIMECIDNLNLSEEQYNDVETFISMQENLRCIYYNKCNDAAQLVHRLIDEKNDKKEMIDALGAFMNYHDIYLFYDSYWQMLRWSFLMDHTNQVDFNKFWKKQKYNEYAPARIQKRFDECAKYWPESGQRLEVKNKNTFW
ncbi:hypothetical protein GGR21_001349 [Dysgonomonas hofstadii]|uniref:YARHG domain-containing protein n=1 Tax=Dysgonomonas hofstadii TaxID=637886 RepID=A0A840CJC5_9BACT|nr:DNRLRE domain-containing protein [Dysgonomonas hofstadii]MBB4035456.1 hypothetical protein [Dysgonomonas hofstadii]